MLAGLGVEGPLDRLAAILAHAAVEAVDARSEGLGIGDRGVELLEQPALGVGVLGEDQHPPGQPLGPGLAELGALVRADPLEQALEASVGAKAVGLGDLAHAREQLALGLVGDLGVGVAAGGLELGLLLDGDLVLGQLGALVLAAHALAQQGEIAGGLLGRALPGLADFFGLALDRPLVDDQRPIKGLDRRQQPLLQRGQHEHRRALAAAAGRGHALEPELAQALEQARELELGGVVGQAVDDDGLDHPLGELAGHQLADVSLEPADHHVGELLGLDGHPPAKALRIEDLEQGREAVGVAVVGRGRQEQLVLEARREVADRAGEVGVDGVAGPAGRGRVVSLV